MGQRAELQALLEELLGTPDVYFQPPANVQMVYPCIVYQRDRLDTEFAGNAPYRLEKRYQVTYVDRKPDNEVITKIAALPLCSYVRFFVAENLNHDVFSLYF